MMTIVMLITFPPMSMKWEKIITKQLTHLFIDTGLPFENQGFVNFLGLFYGYIT